MCVANPTVAFILSPEESVEEYIEDVGILLQTVSVSFSVSTQRSDCQIDCNIANVGLVFLVPTLAFFYDFHCLFIISPTSDTD